MFRKLILVLTLLVISATTHAALEIQITGGINEGRKIAVLPFNQPKLGVDIASVVTADLMRSGKFSPLSNSQIPANIYTQDTLGVNIEILSGTSAEVAVFGNVYPEAGKYQIEYKIIALQGSQKGKILAHYKGASPVDLLRQAAHRVSDRVYETILGQKGAFRTKIAYVVFRPGQKYPYTLMTSDYDGFNETPILKSTQPIMTPNWSPDGTRLVYVSFEKRQPAIFVQDLYTKKRVKLASFKGLNSSPSWSPDGTKIAMTLSKDGQPDIYYYDLVQKRLVRVTNSRSIDTEPTWGENSDVIYFTSERGGRAQIYKFDFASNQTQRVTYQGAMNLSAKTIPGSDAIIVVTRAPNGGYRVARVDKDGGIYMLTTSSLDESPSVAPNGSMVIYSTVYQGRKGLALVSADGRFKANLPSSSGEVSAPSWGPIIEK